MSLLGLIMSVLRYLIILGHIISLYRPTLVDTLPYLCPALHIVCCGGSPGVMCTVSRLARASVAIAD